jgi:hypothetical protein
MTVVSMGGARTSDVLSFDKSDPNSKNPMPTFIRMASNLRIKPDNSGKFDN